MHYKTYAIVFSVIVLGYRSFFTVKETEFVLVTQFGRPLYAVNSAGLHARWAFQSASYFDRRLRIYNPRPSEFLTRDKKNIVVDSYVAWRIQDPNRFLQSVGDPIAAEMRLHDIVWSGLSAALGARDLDSLVMAAPGKAPASELPASELPASELPASELPASELPASELMDALTGLTDRAALAQYGINVADVRIKRLNLPEQNKQSVYARMRAERERIARQYRAEGEEQALSIRADADRQKAETLSLAYKEAERIRGEGDAESTRIYGQAYSKNPRFYKLLRTLEAYKKVLDEKTTAILSSDSELLRILTHGEQGAR
jgi:membrane protease subunit HflC